MYVPDTSGWFIHIDPGRTDISKHERGGWNN